MKKFILGLIAAISFTLAFTGCNNNITAENCDFIYEVVNNSSQTFSVYNYIVSYSTSNDGIVLKRFEKVTLETNQTYDFYYDLKDLKDTYGSNSTYMAVYFDLNDKGYSYGWMNNLFQNGRKHTVTVIDSEQYYIDGVNSWETLSNYELKTAESNEDFIYEIVNNSSNSVTVSNYLTQYNKDYTSYDILLRTKDVVIPSGETYQFKYNLSELKETYSTDYYRIGAFFYPENKWENFGWENNLNQTGKKHTVTITDPANSNYSMDAVNSWSNL